MQPLILPSTQSLFRDRSDRFRQLATKTPSLAGYLELLAELAGIQQALADGLSNHESAISTGGAPQSDAANLNPAWRETLRWIAQLIGHKQGAVGDILDRIEKADDDEMEGWARTLLAMEPENLDPALSPFVAAALQVHFTSMASRLDASSLAGRELGSFCPVCGFHPVAAVLQTGGSVHGLRYLSCALCATQWNKVRLHCIHCGSSKDVAYYEIEGAGGAVKAEACDGCKTYIKLVNREKDAKADPLADDIASLALDIMMGEAGYQRLGLNPFLIPSGSAL